MSDGLKIAIAGLGTVGTGTVALLAQHGALLKQRCGRAISVVAVSARNRDQDRGVDLSNAAWYDDATAMARDADADVVLELIGGEDGPAKAVCEAAIAAGRDRLAERGRILVRASGTEPLVRVMIEGEDGTQVVELTRQLAAAVDEALSV